MAVDFRINNLGGLNLGQAVRQGYDIYQQQRQNTMQDEALAKQEMQQEELQGLMAGAAKGDADAIETLYSRNPKLAAQFEQRDLARAEREGQQAAQASKQREVEFATRYRAASPEQKSALLQEAAADSMIDIDDEDLALNPEQAEAAVNLMLFQNLGKDGYKALVTDTQPEITTEYQQGMLDAKKVDQDLRREELELKKLQAEERQAKNDLDKEAKKVAIEEKQQKVESAKMQKAQQLTAATENSKSLVTIIDDILGENGGTGYVDKLTGWTGRNPLTVTDEGKDAEVIFDQLTNTLTLDNLKLMSGVLTDKDIALLRSAASGLEKGMSESKFKSRLKTIRGNISKNLNRSEKEINKLGVDLGSNEIPSKAASRSEADILAEYGIQ